MYLSQVNTLKDKLQSIEPRELQIRESNSISNEICQNLPELQNEERYVTTDRVSQSSPIVHQPSPKHSPKHNPVQCTETDNGINPQNSENPDQQSSYYKYLQSGRNNEKSSHDSINNNSDYHSNSNNFTEQILPNDDTTPIPTRASSQASSLSIPLLQSQLQEQIQDPYSEYSNTEAIQNPYSKVGSFLPTSYTINEVLRSICKNDDKKIQSVKKLTNNFDKVTQLSRLTQQFPEERQNIHYPVVSSDITHSLPMKTSHLRMKNQNNKSNVRNSLGSEHQAVERKAKVDTNRIKTQELYVKILKCMKDRHSKTLKQFSKEELLKIFSDVLDDEEGKECIIKISSKKLSNLEPQSGKIETLVTKL